MRLRKHGVAGHIGLNPGPSLCFDRFLGFCSFCAGERPRRLILRDKSRDFLIGYTDRAATCDGAAERKWSAGRELDNVGHALSSFSGEARRLRRRTEFAPAAL